MVGNLLVHQIADGFGTLTYLFSSYVNCTDFYIRIGGKLGCWMFLAGCFSTAASSTLYLCAHQLARQKLSSASLSVAGHNNACDGAWKWWTQNPIYLIIYICELYVQTVGRVAVKQQRSRIATIGLQVKLYHRNWNTKKGKAGCWQARLTDCVLGNAVTCQLEKVRGR